MIQPWQLTVFSCIKIALALILFSRRMERKSHINLRIGIFLVSILVLSSCATLVDYSIYPTLTTLFSLIGASVSLFITLTIFIAFHQLLYQSSLASSVFCCSLAFLLEMLNSTLERFSFHFVWEQIGLSTITYQYLNTLLVSAIVFFSCYKLAILRIEREDLISMNDPIMLGTLASAYVFNIVFDLVIKDLGVFDIPMHYKILLHLVYIAFCIYLLYTEIEIVYNRKLLIELSTLENIRAREASQFALSKNTIEAINVKCHDIRHQIRNLQDPTLNHEVLNDIAKEVNIYEAFIRTGNSALDTILTEKSLICEASNISFSCIADGEALSHMKTYDVYSFFGNALENAIEAVSILDDQERRSISLVVQKKQLMVSIHIENYFNGKLLKTQDGRILTTKNDERNHGFGVQSMRRIVDSYGGMFSITTHEDIFCLDALIPQSVVPLA